MATTNPYTEMQANALTAASNKNLATNVLPGINSGAQAAGQYGGTRQGIAQGVAAGQAQTGLNSALANLYSGNYATDTNAGLQQQSIDNSYNLGLGQLGVTSQGQQLNYNLGLGGLANQATGQNQNFYSTQRGQDLQQYQLGSNLYNAGVQGNVGLGQGMYNTGQTYQNAPLTAIQQYGSTISPYTGYGQSSTSTGSSSTLANTLGGATAGNALQNLWSGASNGLGANYNTGSEPYPGYNASIGLK